jgi:uncharacterized membrane protein
VIGVIGCFIDSIFGATIQAKYIGSKTKLVTESKKSNGKQNQRISGLSFMNNDMVNLTSSIIGGIGAFIFFTVF